MINKLNCTAEKYSYYEKLTLLVTINRAFQRDTRTVKVALDAFRRYEEHDEKGNCIVPAQFYTVDVKIAPTPSGGWFVRMHTEDYEMLMEAIAAGRLHNPWPREVLIDKRQATTDDMLILYADRVHVLDDADNIFFADNMFFAD